MSRLAATLACDLKVQYRNGFYYAVAVVLAGLAVLLTLVPIDWSYWLPALVLGNLMVGTFYFMGGLVLLEKGERTLEALVVTPLTDRQYLTSKVATLTGLAIVEHFTLAALATGSGFDPLPLLAALISGSVIYCLFGFLAVSRYDSINEYLFPSTLYSAFFAAPLLDYFGLLGGPLFALHPLQGTLLLLRGAFVVPLVGAEWVFGIVASAVWIVLLAWLCRRWFHRFVVRTEGVR